MALIRRRVFGGWDSDCFNLDHPAGPEARENGVDLPGQFISLIIRRAFCIGTGEIPSGHQASVLEKQDPVFDQAGIWNEIGKGWSRRSKHA
ncbi:hypothetical protein D3C80_1707650 [compost metagenome]